ncbi:MAG: hypothetical protein JXA25_06805 [Anaerolineales bacterium]|nr:hypothetical protein [Anaerolineales bacterium]
MTKLQRSIVLMIMLILMVMFPSACGPGRADNPADYRHTGAVEYFLYVPEDYTLQHTWPLFVGIHGGSGSGSDCWNTWQPYAKSEGFFLLCPILADSSGGWYQNTAESVVASLITRVRQDYNIKSEVVLAGFSAGA